MSISFCLNTSFFKLQLRFQIICNIFWTKISEWCMCLQSLRPRNKDKLAQCWDNINSIDPFFYKPQALERRGNQRSTSSLIFQENQNKHVQLCPEASLPHTVVFPSCVNIMPDLTLSVPPHRVFVKTWLLYSITASP